MNGLTFLHYILIILGVLIVLTIYLSFEVFKLKKRLNRFLKRGEKDLEDVLLNQTQKLGKQGKDINRISLKVSELDKISQKSVQKIGIVRFNPFRDVGGDQSFSIALLDSKNNGFVITSHYYKEFNRVYAKPLNNGDSQYPLSKEEREAIDKAKS